MSDQAITEACAACGRAVDDRGTKPCSECAPRVAKTFLREAALVVRPVSALVERKPVVKL